MTRSDKDLYRVLYPAGWCIVPTMETLHHQLWSEIVRETLHLDSLGRLLVQLIIMFQVEGGQRKQDCSNKEDFGCSERKEVCVKNHPVILRNKSLFYMKKNFIFEQSGCIPYGYPIHFYI